ncbi:hypothetical protein H2198_003559 [Neophaeococcomyces mojaviensis]|uniref:Uncharacterized protein n=1 Tax=Neophaeococcomyces mojaviensis TaxID=3383035 RepID=A0ACC3AB15_9EURO|nr:hypothetical protein H2198_003559 [Knufia sp. JES_112]
MSAGKPTAAPPKRKGRGGKADTDPLPGNNEDEAGSLDDNEASLDDGLHAMSVFPYCSHIGVAFDDELKKVEADNDAE